MTTAAESLSRRKAAVLDCACMQVAFVIRQATTIIKSGMTKPTQRDTQIFARIEKHLDTCWSHISERKNAATFQRRLGEGWGKAKDAIHALKAADPTTEAAAIIDACGGLAHIVAVCTPPQTALRHAWLSLSNALAALFDRLIKVLKVPGVGEMSWPLLAGLENAMTKELEVYSK